MFVSTARRCLICMVTLIAPFSFADEIQENQLRVADTATIVTAKQTVVPEVVVTTKRTQIQKDIAPRDAASMVEIEVLEDLNDRLNSAVASVSHDAT